MTRPWLTPRTALAAAVLLVGAVLGALATSGEAPASTTAAAGSASAPSAFTSMTVVGDSITALYNDRPGDERQGWWSIVGRALGVPVERYAQPGSGYLREGDRCRGVRFSAHTGALASAPSLLVLEGGRNDWSFCRDGVVVPAPDAMVDEAVDAYMDTVQETVPASTRVVVLGPPWGPVAHRHAERVTGIVRSQAQAHGFEFVDMAGVLDASSVYDGIHPDRDGSRAIARRVLAALEGAQA